MIVPIVEGQSEERAIGTLIRRVLYQLEVFDLGVARPLRVKRQRVVRADELERYVLLAQRSREGASAVLVILDADSDCPAALGPALLARGKSQTNLPVRVVIPKIEIEAWVLAAVDSVRGVRGIRADAVPPPALEDIRDAKGALSRLMEGGRGYVATDDLPALFEQIDLQLAEERSSSFAKFGRDIASLVVA